MEATYNWSRIKKEAFSRVTLTRTKFGKKGQLQTETTDPELAEIFELCGATITKQPDSDLFTVIFGPRTVKEQRLSAAPIPPKASKPGKRLTARPHGKFWLADMALIGAVDLNHEAGINRALAAGATINLIFMEGEGPVSLYERCLAKAHLLQVPAYLKTAEYLQSKGALTYADLEKVRNYNRRRTKPRLYSQER